MVSRATLPRLHGDSHALRNSRPNSTPFLKGDRVGRCSGTRGPRSGRPIAVRQCVETDKDRDTEPVGTSSSEGSSYGETTGVVKSLVGGLTDVVNWCGELVGSPGTGPGEGDEDTPPAEAVAPQQVFQAVREDFTERGYPWSGEISEEMYDKDCMFTDPTLSFRGLAKFRRNLANLKPIVERFVGDREVELFSCDLDTDNNRVSASWRMYGELDLPWKPCIDVSGRTVFTYDVERGNRIVSYYETWEIPPAQALLQLLRPGKKT